jgi:hypothetical protein
MFDKVSELNRIRDRCINAQWQKPKSASLGDASSICSPSG